MRRTLRAPYFTARGFVSKSYVRWGNICVGRAKDVGSPDPRRGALSRIPRSGGSFRRSRMSNPLPTFFPANEKGAAAELRNLALRVGFLFFVALIFVLGARIWIGTPVL